MAKPAAFLPNPKDGETSVFRHGKDPLASLWEIGASHITGERRFHGAAVFKAHHVRVANLEVAAKEPPPRHANIIGWPMSAADPDLAKAKCKELAMLIAQGAELVIR